MRLPRDEWIWYKKAALVAMAAALVAMAAALVAMAVGWTACTSTTCFLIRFSSVVLGLGWATRASNGFMSQVMSLPPYFV
ncbi:hypothetical protein T484DRAFT_1827787 [Baffinella frigidus]|nr:hypothetical protein T484DRAFT_1827787 [Cryptophyta sp. CCMP2293]